MNLSEIYLDSLREIFNIAIGRAASSLSTAFEKEVELSVPKILLVIPDEALDYLPIPKDIEVCAVSQSYSSKEITLKAKLIFSEENSLKLARYFLREQIVFLEEVTQLEQDTILEIGNIFINNFIGTIDNLSRLNLEGSLPEIALLHAHELFSTKEYSGDSVMIEVFVNFSIKAMDITGYLVLIIDSNFIDNFIEKVYRSLLGNHVS